MDDPNKTIGRKPDYRLRVKDKLTNEALTVGAGWKNPDGSISLQMSKLISINLSTALYITLFPIDENHP